MVRPFGGVILSASTLAVVSVPRVGAVAENFWATEEEGQVHACRARSTSWLRTRRAAGGVPHGLPGRSARPALHHQIDARRRSWRAGWLALGWVGGNGLGHMDHAFIAMMGFTVKETPIHYDKPTTFASLGVAVSVMVGIGISSWVTGAPPERRCRRGPHRSGSRLDALSGHVASMRLNGKLGYDAATVSASVVIAVVAATAALWAAALQMLERGRQPRHGTGRQRYALHGHGRPERPSPRHVQQSRRRFGRRTARAHDDRPAGLCCLAGVVVMFDPLMVMGRPTGGPRSTEPASRPTPRSSTSAAACRAPAGSAATAARAPQEPVIRARCRVRVVRWNQYDRIKDRTLVAPFEVVSPPAER